MKERRKQIIRGRAPKPKETKSQGIVRDLRGQEQPADKKRARSAGPTSGKDSRR